MAEHLTEEEQIETIKQWWSDNWLSVVVPIVFAALAYGGWNWWSDKKVAEAAQASEQYDELTSFLQSAGPELTEEQSNEALTLADGLRRDFDGTLYGDMSSMILARLYLDQGKTAEAETALRNVVESAKTESVQVIAKARLAKVLLEQDQHSEALALVPQTDNSSIKALYAETRGDIYLDQGEIAAANTAYAEALASLAPQQFSRRGILQFKLDSTRATENDELAMEPQDSQVVESAAAETAAASSGDQE